jgi:hypothetical protein
MKKRLIVGIVSAVLVAVGLNMLGVFIDIAAYSWQAGTIDRR